ncbi:MAG: pyrroline-5-carboxylate reductase [Pirellulaceae bacterium]|nr:MAG: pyrroline-5-carboxylate reductase [Pirellulaceae bacterium]
MSGGGTLSELKQLGIVGGGQMAQALLGGAVKSGILKVADVLVAEPDASRRTVLQEQFPGLQTVDDAEKLAERCARLLLAVKPQVLRAIGSDIGRWLPPERLVISIAAGVSLDELCNLLKTRQVIRVMPNTPCLVGAGASAMAATAEVNADDLQWTEQLLQSMGMVVRVPDSLMHAVTGLSGSGPAYLYLVIEALSDGGVASGLPRATALQLAAQTVWGAAQMVMQSGRHPGELKDQVTSPGGTTIAGLQVLEQRAIRSALIDAVCQAARRSKELSSPNS